MVVCCVVYVFIVDAVLSIQVNNRLYPSSCVGVVHSACGSVVCASECVPGGVPCPTRAPPMSHGLCPPPLWTGSLSYYDPQHSLEETPQHSQS